MIWNIDNAHSEVQFKVKHLVISTVTGSFASFEGQAVTEGESFEGAQVSFSLDVASITTKQTDRDNHLKSADFFDVEQHPKITFSDGVLHKKTSDEFVLEGNLTIKGVTKPVVLAAVLGGIAKDPWGNTKAGFEVKGRINRKDYGITWNAATEAGGLLVGEDVAFDINIQLAKA
ncbi:MAG TPA: YceI family protein [Cytophagales bacterium]|nr:YceI family protein [Cytophagales bacterium]